MPFHEFRIAVRHLWLWWPRFCLRGVLPLSIP
jgi:hypothetical protein